MATSLTTINNNTHQWRQLFSLPFCKCFSTSFLHNSPTFAFPPPKQALISPKLLPHFFSVKHHFSVITVKDPVTLSSFNSNSSTETLDFIKSNDSLSIGFCLDETKNEKKQRSEKEKSGDNGKSRKNGVGSSFEARNEKGTGSFSYRSSNDRKDRRLEGVSGELSRNDDGFGRREFGSENGGRSSGRIDFGRRKEKGSEFSMSRSNSRKERGEMDEIVGDNGKSRNSRKNGIGSTLEARHEKGINDGKDRKLEGIIGGLSKDNDGFRRREFGSESGVRAGGRIDIRKKSEKGSELSMSRSNSGKERGEMEESIGELFDNEKGSYSFSSRSSNDREGTNLEGVIVELSKKNDRFSRREFGSKNGERIDFGKRSEKGSEFSISRLSSRKERGEMEGVVDKVAKSNDGSSGRGLESGSRGQKGVWLSPKRQRDGNLGTIGVNGEVDHGRTIKRDGGNNVSKGKKQRVAKKGKAESPEFKLRVGLDMCSKNGDVMGAISLYDSAVQREVNMGQYHYTVLLYLCSSAAMGIVRPAKSGSGSRSLDKVGPQDWDESDDSEDEDDDTDDKEDEALDVKDQTQKVEVNDIRVSDDVKKYALEKGFEIYERMCLGKVQMNEAALTSVARLAMAMGDGDMAFDMVKQMKSLGIRTRLRSYGPALSVFTGRGELDKAFAVEEHMLENGVYPEEPELEALLRVSVQTGKADRVYYVLHKLRTSVRAVSPSTADLIEKWFMGKEATRIGKRKWDQSMIAQTMQNNGGGWHGQGWLGRGKWTVSQTSIGEDGLCKCCGEKLALIDLDPEETERFAESVASIALKREKNLSFQKFQKWLDYYGPYEAVVDAANVGLFSQRKFKPSKVNAVVNGVRQMLPSRKWPLIVLHNKRVTGSKMEQPVNRALVERWKNADALFATPTGSNDDWYWLYAAIKYKCLLVTNDEMRDHTFQLLGNDFFPKWKERHQVRFSFSEIGPVFHMPPPCSVVIQESDKGHWHIPVASEQQSEADRTWLCITRSNLLVVQQDLKVGANSAEGFKDNLRDKKQFRKSSSLSYHSAEVPLVSSSEQESKELFPNAYKDPRNMLPESVTSNSEHIPVWHAIETAEKFSGCTIDFQI